MTTTDTTSRLFQTSRRRSHGLVVGILLVLGYFGTAAILDQRLLLIVAVARGASRVTRLQAHAIAAAGRLHERPGAGQRPRAARVVFSGPEESSGHPGARLQGRRCIRRHTWNWTCRLPGQSAAVLPRAKRPELRETTPGTPAALPLARRRHRWRTP